MNDRFQIKVLVEKKSEYLYGVLFEIEPILAANFLDYRDQALGYIPWNHLWNSSTDRNWNCLGKRKQYQSSHCHNNDQQKKFPENNTKNIVIFLLIVNILMVFEGPHSNTFIYIESVIIFKLINLFYLPDILHQLNCPLLLQFQEHYLSNIKKTMIFIVIA